MTNETNALQSLKNRKQDIIDSASLLENLCNAQGVYHVLNRLLINEALEKISMQIENVEKPIKVSEEALWSFVKEFYSRECSHARDVICSQYGLKECVDKLGDGTYPITRELEAVVVDRVVVDVRRKGE